MNRATRDMDCKTIHTDRKRIRVNRKLIGINSAWIDNQPHGPGEDLTTNEHQ
jgi:hypothetical protein